ncbi:VaFE repeat-containing surface-anchored protein, partial [Candidatus Saccharibacteria bacterium]|nr:VaFE repeat-containing surface-anchored protein [Candidatus Saccharibacteria bacterium]
IIKETAASSGYNPNPEEMTVTIDDNTTKVENIPTATVTFPNDRTNINIIVHKRDDKIRTTCETQGGASFAGITFRLVTSDGQPVSGVADQTLGENQCEVTFNNLPLGNYKVIEVSAGAGGYTVASRPNNEQNVDPDNPEVTFYNSPVRGSVTIQKIDASTGTSIPSGNNTFNGTTFKITNRTGKAIWYGNNKIENNQTIVEGLTLNNNQSTIIVEGLPFGNYEVEETGANNGYQSPNGTKKQTVTISNAASPNVTVTFDNEPKLGKITIQKRDAITGTTPSGNNTFVGTTFKIYNNSTNAIMYDNQLRSPSLQTEFAYRTITTDNNASVEFANLPYGTYRIVETAVSAGYLLPDNGHNYIDITIPGNDGLDITKTFDNTPKTGSVTINKVDKETGTCATKRGYSFSGVEFEIINASNNPIEYGHKYVRQNERITTGTITGNNCSVVFNDLPYGNYIIKELKTSNNYVLDTETEYPVTIPNDNNVLNITTTVENQVIRGDLKILKKDADNKTTLSDVLFRVSALDENNQPIESHIVITDEHGIADTSVIPHSKNTNGYDELYEAFQPGDQPITYNKEYGTWFFREDDEGNYSSQIDDTLGALPYGKYLIEELECRSNLFCYIKENQSTIIDITNTDTVTIDWDNHCTVFSLKTTATDEKDGDKFVEINRKARIKDTIEYCVTPGLDFTIKGILMDKSTEQPLLVNGKPIEQVIHLNSETECGTTSMTFKFNAAMLAGKNVVVYESLYYGDELITNHEDITDEGQTVTIVSLYTYATNKETNEKVLAVDKDVEIKDTVKYCLKPGLQYTVKGVLMNKETKEPVLINGNPVEQTATFVPEKACGELDMYLALNTTGLGGGQFVIFESLYLGEKPLDEKTPIIEHKDFDNDAESVIVEPPVPNTGLFTRKSTESTTQNDSTIFIIGGFAIVIAIGGYGITRTFSRRNFFRK